MASTTLVDTKTVALLASEDRKLPGVARQTTRAAEDRAVDLLRCPGAVQLLLAGLIFDTVRGIISFLAPYFVNQETESTLLVGLVGSGQHVFLVFGPFAGAIADRLGRKFSLVISLAACTVATAVMVLALLRDASDWPAAFLYVVAVSLCGVMDATSRPALMFDVLAARRLEGLGGMANALRSAGFCFSRSVGSQMAGALVGTLGVAGAFAVVCQLLIAALLLVLQMPELSVKAPESPGRRANFFEDFTEGLKMARTNKELQSIVLITLAVNFFWFSHPPLLQVIAAGDGPHDTAAWRAGLLTAAPGYGMLLTSLAVSFLNPKQPGWILWGGCFLADFFLIGAASPNLWAAIVWLFVSGLTLGGFIAVQGAMLMELVPQEMRGRALGLLSMAIGAMPAGMAVMGEVGARIGARNALRTFACAGCLAQLLILLVRPQAARIRSAR